LSDILKEKKPYDQLCYWISPKNKTMMLDLKKIILFFIFTEICFQETK